MAPDGEIISLGGAILLGNGQSLDADGFSDGQRQQDSTGLSQFGTGLS